ncbi:hypothetical protein CPB86DRAFT_801899 [Serendipita vermifera]|nr:hypothetical protein CPB86DRAFT_801899 [Serendipita vermifera]
MSRNWEYAPISPQDKDFISENQQTEPTQSVDSREDRQEMSQKDNLKLHKHDTSQTFTNADVGDVLQIPDWPGPQTLEVTRGKSILYGIGSMLYLVPPLIFLGLVLSTIGLHSQKAGRFGEFGPTVFPIAFSAIMGWCLKNYGRYKSERGVKLGELERVIGSQTLFSFLRFVFTFKQFDRLCIILGFLWVLSPLGGQAILRMLSMRQVVTMSSEAIKYLNLYADSSYYSLDELDLMIMERSGKANPLYASSLYAPVEVRNRTTDQWGAIKIPSIESLDFDRQDDDGVVVGDVLTYTSLLGIPINSTAYKTASKYSFTLNTTAFSAQCEEPITLYSLLGYNLNARIILESHSISASAYKRNITLITQIHDMDKPWVFVVHYCTVTPNFLLAKVDCYSGHCSVSRIKKLPDLDDQQVLKMLDSNTWRYITVELPSVTDDQSSGVPSQTELYLLDPQSLYPVRESASSAVRDFRNIPIVDLTKRFTTILNTYYQATISPDLRINARLNPPIDEPNYPNDTFTTTVATIHTLSPETYQRHWGWVIPALVASLAMLGVAITGILLEKRAIGPDIYGYVSSMTRDSPYFPLPPNGCTLEGTNRAVLLKDVFV